MIISFIISAVLSLLPRDEPTCEPIPASECGAPLCVTIKDGVAHTGPCEDCGGVWAPGTAVTCGDIVCQPQNPASTCRWVCRPSADW